MALIENQITYEGVKKINKVDIAIQRLKAFEPEEGYWLAFSGGKDSVVIKRLAEMAGVKHENHYSVTSVDPPELVRFIKTMPDVSFDIPHDKDGKPITMWNLIVKKRMPPTRVQRYCCEKLKESKGNGRIVVTGVRWAESKNRSKNRHLIDIGGKGGIIYNDDNSESKRMVEQCYRTSKTLLNPVIDWTDGDVWEFIKQENIKYCGLYDEGLKRLGCIGCPLADCKKELARWPKYENLYIKAFQRMYEKRINDGILTTAFGSGQECFDWWTGKTPNKQIDGQIMMEIE